MVIITATVVIFSAIIVVGGPFAISGGMLLTNVVDNAIDKVIFSLKNKKIIKKIFARIVNKKFKIKSGDKLLEEICVFCQEDYVVGDKCCSLHCGHSYHQKCLKHWVIVKEKCPLCNQ